MISLRGAREEDVKDLAELAKFPGQGFYGLPKDEVSLLERIEHSRKSFSRQLKDKNRARYIFVAEDFESKKIIGTSTIRAQYGREASPNFYFEVGREKKYSETIHTGFIHGTLLLKYDTNGPTEIGGLVVHPDYRKKEAKIGRQISFVRFMYMALNKDQFQKRVMTELLPPFNKEGLSPLWEAVGRRFTNMEYWEADQLATKSKEFILSLFPTGKIYTTFLPAEARDAIGKVGKQTKAVYHMLTKIGLKYEQKIDPFDGGPFLSADLDRVRPVENLKSYRFGGLSQSQKTSRRNGLICTHSKKDQEFIGVHADVTIKEDQIFFSESQKNELKKIIHIEHGQEVHFMAYY